MTCITQVLIAPATGAYYYEDLAALQSHPTPLAERYAAAPMTNDTNFVKIDKKPFVTFVYSCNS